MNVAVRKSKLEEITTKNKVIYNHISQVESTMKTKELTDAHDRQLKYSQNLTKIKISVLP